VPTLFLAIFTPFELVLSRFGALRVSQYADQLKIWRITQILVRRYIIARHNFGRLSHYFGGTSLLE
jgi:hypothetical protein